MLKLSDLNEELKTLSGTPIANIDNTPLTRKTALIAICELHKPTQGSGDGMKAYEIGARIYNAKDSLEISTEDLMFLKILVNKSEVFYSVVIGLLSTYLNEIK